MLRLSVARIRQAMIMTYLHVDTLAQLRQTHARNEVLKLVAL